MSKSRLDILVMFMDDPTLQYIEGLGDVSDLNELLGELYLKYGPIGISDILRLLDSHVQPSAASVAENTLAGERENDSTIPKDLPIVEPIIKAISRIRLWL